jgi:hypothetical protein
MITFKEFQDSDKGLKSQEKALEVVRKGINLKPGDDFWEDFLNLCSNAEGMASLLDVPKEKITGLAGKINKLRGKVKDMDSTKSKDKLIKTGSTI